MVEYSVVRSRRRSLSISVGRSGVVVRSPMGAPNGLIRGFVSENSAWIERQLSRIKSEADSVRESGMYVSRLPYMGRLCGFSLSVGKTDRVVFSGGSFRVRARDSKPESVYRAYSKWLRKEAPSVFRESISRHAGLIGASPSSVSVRDQRTRWGSASPSGRVSLNFNLLKAPQDVIDYVVVHELCHLRVADHSKRFWSLVESVMPGYKSRRKWLRENRHLLRGTV